MNPIQTVIIVMAILVCIAILVSVIRIMWAEYKLDKQHRKNGTDFGARTTDVHKKGE